MALNRNSNRFFSGITSQKKIKHLEHQLRNIVKPLLEKARPGDYRHTLRSVAYGKLLLIYEDGDPEIVLPALYLHDIGWSKVDFRDFIAAPTFAMKRQSLSFDAHMKYGAVMARDILRRIGFEASSIDLISLIISIHDYPEKVFDMKNPSATLVVEADRLDRFGPAGRKRLKTVFGLENHQQDKILALTKGMEGLVDKWFRTKTAKSLAIKMGTKNGLLSAPI